MNVFKYLRSYVRINFTEIFGVGQRFIVLFHSVCTVLCQYKRYFNEIFVKKVRDNFSLIPHIFEISVFTLAIFSPKLPGNNDFHMSMNDDLIFHSLRSGSYWWSFGEATSLNWRIWQYLLVRFLGRSLQRRHGQREMCRIGKTVCHPCNHKGRRKWRMCEVRGH